MNRLLLVVFIVLFLIGWLLFNSRTPVENGEKYDLNRDGVQIYKSIVSKDEVQRWKRLCSEKKYKELKTDIQSNPKLQSIVKSISPDYDFQDYVLVIEKSAVHTCHRDYNGTFSNPTQKHKSYTIIVYLEPMEKCLGVIPRSHLSKHANAFNVNVKNNVRDLLCSDGDAILFDANLIHVGTINDRDDNLRVQMKITHRDDLETLSYYQKYKCFRRSIFNSDSFRL